MADEIPWNLMLLSEENWLSIKIWKWQINETVSSLEPDYTNAGGTNYHLLPEMVLRDPVSLIKLLMICWIWIILNAKNNKNKNIGDKK